ncbi:alpha/beta fold hydrolase [Aliiglaciecola sp. LCG003]|uniref:alpha/beta fold hydrolase n=1 Tax=Aliiglaciecola sp. LCG003 TaxID=3053655 RepID=UPI0025740F8A|nr:alpha/beta fold hydrolase [Aliiglaciecola sp. LCG003]WJG11055.1 alpha/beta fold hydrolase [Aliiglaciecola sp. LCG003]
MSQLHYQLSSRDKNKPYLVLLHGLFGNSDNLLVIQKGLADTFNIINIDLPDHGRSAFSQTFSFESYAQQISELINSLGIGTVNLLGHSLGGKVAMTLALSHSDLISKLIVADIAPVHYSPRHQNVFKALNAVNLDEIESRAQATQILSDILTESGVAAFLAKSLYQHNERWSWRFNLAMLQRDYAQLSAAIRSDTVFHGPVLFIKGGRSDYIKSDHRDAIVSLFPNSDAKIIGSAGHWLHAEKPVVFNRLVREFLHKDG